MQQLTLPLNSSGLNIRRSSRAKKLRISINPIGQIEVVAPKNSFARDIEQFIQSQHGWIARTKCKIESLRNKDLDSNMPSSIYLPAIEERWNVFYKSGCSRNVTENKCVTNNNTLRLTIDHESQTGELLKKWLTVKAKSSLLPWLRKVSNETGLSYSQASVRGQKTRWASCSAGKNISLNRCMLFLSAEQVRYLMVHELCHTKEMNHSARFWKLVGQFMPDYQYQEARVNECCYKLPRWAY